MVFYTENPLSGPYMSAWRAGLSLWMIGSEVFPEEERAIQRLL